MNKITFPLKLGMKGADVSNLQNTLQLLLDRGALLAKDEVARRELSGALKGECAKQVYGEATNKLVNILQEESGLKSTDVVDAATAKIVNRLLKKVGESKTVESYVVQGQVRDEKGIPIGGLIVRAFDKDTQGDNLLGEAVTDKSGQYRIAYSGSRFLRSTRRKGGTELVVYVFNPNGALIGASSERKKPGSSETMDLVVNPGTTVGSSKGAFTVNGVVSSQDRAGISGLRVELVDKSVGQDFVLGKTVTDENGSYSVQFHSLSFQGRGKLQPDLQARVYTGSKFLGISEVRYNATSQETLNVLLPAGASALLPSELQTLRDTLAKHYSGRLADLKETDDQQDITYLANKSGWDARAVALAALADQFSARTADGKGTSRIPPDFFYAAFRAGVSANEDSLYRMDVKTIRQIWKQASDTGVIPKQSEERITGAVKQFRILAVEHMLGSPALAGVSSLKGMLAASNLDEKKQHRFVELYMEHRDDMEKFWQAVKKTRLGLGPEFAERLRLDGKLNYLTINNVLLNQAIYAEAKNQLPRMGKENLTDLRQLALLGYHRANEWLGLLTAEIPIPQEIPGATPEEKRNNYANYLAAKVRLSYPTASVAEMINSGTLKLPGAKEEVIHGVYKFLSAPRQDGFEIGVQPIEQYIKSNNLNEVSPSTIAQIKRVQRVMQVTPSDSSMCALMNRGIDSAYRVVRYRKEDFVRVFTEDLKGSGETETAAQEEAARVFTRSVQVHNAVLNIAISYLTAKNGIGLGKTPLTAPQDGSDSKGQILQPAPKIPASARDASGGDGKDDIIAYPTLEGLFGSMDYCECDECRSILSPAAYLVDLLQFLHSDDEAWTMFTTAWQAKYQNPYPFIDQTAWINAGSPMEAGQSPFTVLMARRPDIQHLPLTCENTNSALPYIDVVNETLEYYVANGLSLDSGLPAEYQGHDTNGIASEDLLASPQFVLDTAYETLRHERFPIALPFHQPLENLRRDFNKFEVSLPSVMERLRKGDQLDVDRTVSPHPPASDYAWRDIWMEELGLSRAEYDLLTTSTPSPNTLGQIFGFPSGTIDADIIADLSNAKRFSRRLGISYDDLTSILKTQFINPYNNLIPKLDRLGVSFAVLKTLHLEPQSITCADFNNLLPTGASAIDVTAFGGDPAIWKNSDPPNNYAKVIDAWLDADDNYAHIMQLITLTNTKANFNPSDPRSFENLELRHAEPMSSETDTLTRLNEVEFVRLLRFVRLWKKLGWTIEDTDAAICALFPAPIPSQSFAGAIDTLPKLDAGFSTLLTWLGMVFRVMRMLNLKVERGLLPLLACWSDIGTHGENALYRRMFLNPAILQKDAVFVDNGYGEFLQDKMQPLLEGISIKRIKVVGKITIGDRLTTKINEVPIPYTIREGDITAKTLAERISEAINATTAPDPVSGKPMNHVVDASHDSGIVSIKTRMQGSPFSLECSASPDATETYAIINHEPALCAAFNLTSDELHFIADALGFDDQTELSLANISAIFRRGWLAHKLKISVREFLLLINLTGLDPFTFPDLQCKTMTTPGIVRIIALIQALKERSLKSTAALYLIWNQDLSGKSAPDAAQITELARTLRGDFADIDNQFAAIEDPNNDFARAQMTLVYGQETSDAFFALLDDTLVVDTAYTQSAPNLKKAITDVDPQFSYDDFRHLLVHQGLVTEEVKTELENTEHLGEEFKKAVDKLFTNGKVVNDLFLTQHPELKDPFNLAKSKPPADRHGVFLAAFQPELARQRKRQQACQRLSAAAGVDLLFTRTILDPAEPSYPLHSEKSTDKPAMDDVLALETPGLEAQLYDGNSVGDHPQASVIPAKKMDYDSKGKNPLPGNISNPGHLISGVWTGKIETPEAGFYNFIIETDAHAQVKLYLDGKNSLAQHGRIWCNDSPIEFNAGTLHEIVLEVEKVKDRLCLMWETPQRAREVIPSCYLYPPAILDPFSDLYVRILKAASLAKTLALTAAEMAHFAVKDDYRINAQGQIDKNGQGWLNALPNADNLHLTNPSEAVVARTLNASLLTPLWAIMDFSRIKAKVSPGDESLLTVLKNPQAATQNSDGLLFAVTRWNPSSLKDLLTRFGGDGVGLGQFDLFRRVYDAFELIQKMGISALELIRAATNEPTSATVRDLQAALRARYDAAGWRDLVRPINDEMRILQRDALVAYILHQMRIGADSNLWNIDTANKLFEYFLMDVEMEPSMQTSRIRHALSSVQLFIERCLMNLEPQVSSAAINAKQWEWMKRYRVWEANRKVFLYPENWLEPELRDDKSPFFKEIESELLQSDITEDSAANALLNYLSKLEEVAKLEPCGIYHDEEKKVDHIVARTANRKYYYRRRDSISWTPWEQIKLDIEDNPVIPVVWNDRLLLFWLRILKKGPETVANPPSTNAPEINIQGVLCWSEYYNGKWQATKTSDLDELTFAWFPIAGNYAFDRTKLTLRMSTGMSGELLIYVVYPEPYSYKYYTLYNTHSSPILKDFSGPLPLDAAFKESIWSAVGYFEDDDPVLIILEMIMLKMIELNNAGIRTDNPQEIVDVLRADFIFGDYNSPFDRAEMEKIFNNMSQIVNLEEIIKPYLLSNRRIEIAGPLRLNLQGKYYSPNLGDPIIRSLLTNDILARVIEPYHQMNDAWIAPFFYGDNRYVFYVTTKPVKAPLGTYAGYGIMIGSTSDPSLKDLPFILKTNQVKDAGAEARTVGNTINPLPGYMDPSPMRNIISEDTYIRRWVGTTVAQKHGKP